MHLEQLILLFKHFEGINGLRDALLSDLAQTLFKQLTPAADRRICKSSRCGAYARGAMEKNPGRRLRRSRKAFAASAFTETPAAKSAEEFLKSVRNGNCTPRGQGGTPLILSHGFYNTVACFIQDRFHEKLGPSGALLEKMFSRFMEGRAPTEFTLKEKTELMVQGVLALRARDIPREHAHKIRRAVVPSDQLCVAHAAFATEQSQHRDRARK